jgi:hypothetical protein
MVVPARSVRHSTTLPAIVELKPCGASKPQMNSPSARCVWVHREFDDHPGTRHDQYSWRRYLSPRERGTNPAAPHVHASRESVGQDGVAAEMRRQDLEDKKRHQLGCDRSLGFSGPRRSPSDDACTPEHRAASHCKSSTCDVLRAHVKVADQ